MSEPRLSKQIDGACIARVLDQHSKVRDAELAMWKHLAIALETELDDYDQSFELYDNAMRRATKIWHEETNREDTPSVWPDGAKLVAWLIGKMEAMRRQLCSCGFADFDEPNAHHPECNYRVTMVLGEVKDPV